MNRVLVVYRLYQHVIPSLTIHVRYEQTSVMSINPIRRKVQSVKKSCTVPIRKKKNQNHVHFRKSKATLLPDAFRIWRELNKVSLKHNRHCMCPAAYFNNHISQQMSGILQTEVTRWS
jgi:hypothetical protein